MMNKYTIDKSASTDDAHPRKEMWAVTQDEDVVGLHSTYESAVHSAANMRAWGETLRPLVIKKVFA
jgi:hypothetical protein